MKRFLALLVVVALIVAALAWVTSMNTKAQEAPSNYPPGSVVLQQAGLHSDSLLYPGNLRDGFFSLVLPEQG